MRFVQFIVQQPHGRKAASGHVTIRNLPSCERGLNRQRFQNTSRIATKCARIQWPAPVDVDQRRENRSVDLWIEWTHGYRRPSWRNSESDKLSAALTV